MQKKILVVGAGFYGSTMARVLAENNFKVDVIDKRDHIAGNAYDLELESGIKIHKYGPHIFHTKNKEVVDWLSRFTEWIPYKHKVKAMLSSGDLVTLPVNNETIRIVGLENILDTFYKPYTKKMWGIDPDKLDQNILKRVPVRKDDNEYYFPDDKFQGLPKNGYSALISSMLDHKNISIKLKRAFTYRLMGNYFHIFNSMPIDEFFNYKYGFLPYRSIKFHNVTLPCSKIFPVSVVNFTNTSPYTRVTEWKNFPNHGINENETILTYEEPCDFKDNDFERYYPIRDLSNKNVSLYKKYQQETPANMTFIGRCGLYVYIDMDQAVSSALALSKKFLASIDKNV